MTEAQRASASSWRDPGAPVLEAKVAVPATRPDSVSRPGLARAVRSSDCRLVAITAPAGYGKSTFLAEWAAAEDRRVAWLTLDRFDDDPAVLLVSLASAYHQAGLGSAALVADVGGNGVSVLGRAAPLLAWELRTTATPFVLMLDDLHMLRSPGCHDVLGVVLAGVPHGSQVAVASRSEQPHVPRLRTSGEVLEVTAGDLALDASGAQQIFAHTGVTLTAEHADVVTSRSEGWPAGLRLAAMIAKRSPTKKPDVTGDDRYVADYLYSEALAQQPEDTQRFLRRTAVLDQLTAPLCEAVVGVEGAAQQLRHVEAEGLFLIPLDRRRAWYRYHGLFREFLLGELRRTEPRVIENLHRRAADWYEAAGLSTLALEHLLNTTDVDRSVEMITTLSLPTYTAGQLSTVQRWFGAIGEANIERCPPLAVLVTWASVLTGDTAEAERWAAIVDAASFDAAPADGSASFESARAILRAGMCVHGPDTMAADAAFGVTHEPIWSPWRAEALWLLGEARLLAGDLDGARTLFADATTSAVEVGIDEVIPVCEAHLAWLSMDRGDWHVAASRLEVALTTIDENRMHDYVFSATAFTAAARLSVHHSDRDEASRQLTRAMRIRPSATYLLPYHAIRLRLQMAQTYFAIAEPATARQLLREIDDVLIHRPDLGTLTEHVDELRPLIASSSPSVAVQLSPAELRVLPYLQTHLTFRAIAERLFVSRETIKSQTSAIYRKLGVSSRNDAVGRATDLGLLGG